MLDIQEGYSSNKISRNSNVLFLGIKIDNLLTWKDHIDVLVVKLNRYCFAIQAVKSILSLETLKTNVLFICVFHIKLWDNILGQLLVQYKSVFRIQKG
jgi:hypothetical protein